MHEKKLELYLFFVLLGIAFFLTFKIFESYLYTLVIAIVFAVVFFPLHKEILSLMPKWRSTATFLSVFIIAALVLLPLIFFGIQISNEIKHVYDYAFGANTGTGFINNITNTTLGDNLILTLWLFFP